MEKDYDSLKLNRQLCFPLYACAREVTKLYKPFLDPLELTYTQYLAMMVMWEHNETTIKEIGELLHLDSGTLSPLIKKLKSRGLIKKIVCEEDERSSILSLTAEGAELREKAIDIPNKLASCIPLDENEAKQLYTLLYKMLDSFK